MPGILKTLQSPGDFCLHRGGGPENGSGATSLAFSMGGGKTQSMIVAGLLARFPKLAKPVPFKTQPKSATPDHVLAFTGRSTDENVWVNLGQQLGVDFPTDSAPSAWQPLRPFLQTLRLAVENHRA